MIYRSYYVPVKGVIDGDCKGPYLEFSRGLTDRIIVCERYVLLPNDKKQMIAGELDRSVREIERKISVCSPATSHHTSGANRDAGYANSGGLLDMSSAPQVDSNYELLEQCTRVVRAHSYHLLVSFLPFPLPYSSRFRPFFHWFSLSLFPILLSLSALLLFSLSYFLILYLYPTSPKSSKKRKSSTSLDVPTPPPFSEVSQWVWFLPRSRAGLPFFSPLSFGKNRGKRQARRDQAHDVTQRF